MRYGSFDSTILGGAYSYIGLYGDNGVHYGLSFMVVLEVMKTV
jgi:hypothetical protein